MSYNASVTASCHLVRTIPAANAMTLEELQQAIAANTAAIGALVTQFIRPNAQQALENQRSVGQMIDLMDRHTRAIIEIDERLEASTQQIAANAEQIAANTQQIAAIGDRLEQFDQRLEDTRALVAENGSRIAQMSVKQDQILDRVDSQISTLVEENQAFRESQQLQIDKLVEENQASRESQQLQIDRLVEENRAFRESQQSQLAGIIGNGRRIDRLEQQAS